MKGEGRQGGELREGGREARGKVGREGGEGSV